MAPSLGVVMDPLDTINIKKDSTLAMLQAASARDWPLYYMEMRDISLHGDTAMGLMRPLSLHLTQPGWYQLGEAVQRPLAELDVILMRKDPPFDTEYVYSTYILERAEQAGTLVVNRPASLRNANEKLLTAWFPQCCVPSLVSRRHTEIRTFITTQQDVILKPLGEMGGASIFRVRHNDPNINVIIETLTQREQRYIMAQRFIPEITRGDKRILLIDGEPIPYALARLAADGETRANLAAGGRGEGVALSERDRWICAQVGPVVRQMGLMFVGLDVIGDYLTEINSTSPTCIRELDQLYGLDIAGELLDCIEGHLSRQVKNSVA